MIIQMILNNINKLIRKFNYNKTKRLVTNQILNGNKNLN